MEDELERLFDGLWSASSPTKVDELDEQQRRMLAQVDAAEKAINAGATCPDPEAVAQKYRVALGSITHRLLARSPAALKERRRLIFGADPVTSVTAANLLHSKFGKGPITGAFAAAHGVIQDDAFSILDASTFSNMSPVKALYVESLQWGALAIKLLICEVTIRARANGEPPPEVAGFGRYADMLVQGDLDHTRMVSLHGSFAAGSVGAGMAHSVTPSGNCFRTRASTNTGANIGGVDVYLEGEWAGDCTLGVRPHPSGEMVSMTHAHLSVAAQFWRDLHYGSQLRDERLRIDVDALVRFCFEKLREAVTRHLVEAAEAAEAAEASARAAAEATARAEAARAAASVEAAAVRLRLRGVTAAIILDA